MAADISLQKGWCRNVLIHWVTDPMFYQNKYAGWHIGSGYICRVAHGIWIYWQGIMWYQNILARWYAGSEYVVRVIFGSEYIERVTCCIRIYWQGDMWGQNILVGWHVVSEYIGMVTCCVRMYCQGDMWDPGRAPLNTSPGLAFQEHWWQGDMGNYDGLQITNSPWEEVPGPAGQLLRAMLQQVS